MAKKSKGGQKKGSKVESWDDPEKTEVDACKCLRLRLSLNCYWLLFSVHEGQEEILLNEANKGRQINSKFEVG